MIRRNTWILLVLLVALVGFFFYWQKHKTQATAQATTPTAALAVSESLFSAAEGSVTDITVKDGTGQSVEINRNASGTWVLKAPTEAVADQAAAEAAATQVGSLRVLSSVQLGLDIVGLDKPAYTIALVFSNNKTHTLNVGAVTPIQDGYYTSLDGGPVSIVDKPGLDALLQLLSKPPLAATATPPETPTSAQPAPTATTDITATPILAGTATPAATPTP